MSGLGLQFRIILAISICTGITNAFYKYKSSYAFLNVQGGKTSNADKTNFQFCVNFQQWHELDLPASLNEAPVFRLDWWKDKNADVCNGEETKKFLPNAIVPVDYETNITKLKNKCLNFKDEQPIRYLFRRMKNSRIKNIIFLVEKGRRNYLFTHFYNSEIDNADATTNVFYVYNDTFWLQIMPILDKVTPINQFLSDQNQLRIFQPKPLWPMDPAVIVLWFIAFICIFIGSLWSAVDTKAKLTSEKIIHGDESQTELTIEDGEQRFIQRKSQMKRSDSQEIARMSGCQHCCYVGVAVFIVVLILMLAFYFREYAVYFFNLFVIFFGTLSVHSCFYAVLNWAVCGWEIMLGTVGQLFCCKKRKEIPSNADQDAAQVVSTDSNQSDVVAISTVPSVTVTQGTEHTHSTTTGIVKAFLDCRIYLLSTIVYIPAFGLCLFWFFVREQYYAYLLLNPINMCLCIYTIRASRIHTLRLIIFLLLALFVYDLFMVFGTRYITSDGCSVMMQVVTGADCGSNGRSNLSGNSTKQFQPVAPIDAENFPEKLPLIFLMPMLADPMQECYDIKVEREYKRVMLGLGDVIVPGYLIAYCFYVDVMKGNKFHTYGIIALIGYSLGMFCTFVAMLFMETGQPALIYLVPCTLLPVCIWALFVDTKGTFTNMWKGRI